MPKLKWFSGGKERRDDALTLLDSIMIDIRGLERAESLQDILSSYKEELEHPNAPIPISLSRFNVELSGVIRDNNIMLTDSVREKLDTIRKLSYIRYGYY